MRSTRGLAQLLTCKTKIQLQNAAKSVWSKLRTANNQMWDECQLYFQTRMPGKQITIFFYLNAKVNPFAIYYYYHPNFSDSFLHYDLQY